MIVNQPASAVSWTVRQISRLSASSRQAEDRGRVKPQSEEPRSWNHPLRCRALYSTAPRHAVPFATNAMLHASHKECGTNAPAVDDLQVTGSGHTAAQDKQAEAAQTKVSRETVPRPPSLDGALLILSKSSTTAGGTCAWSGEMPSWQAIASQIWTHFMTASMASCAHERLTCVVHEALFGLGHHGAPCQATVVRAAWCWNARTSTWLRIQCCLLCSRQNLTALPPESAIRRCGYASSGHGGVPAGMGECGGVAGGGC